MYVLEDVKGIVRADGIVIEVGKPKIVDGKVVDIPPKEAYKIGDTNERKRLINEFENARINNLTGNYNLATSDCALRGYQGGCALIDYLGKIGVIQKDGFGDAGYLLDIGAGRSDCPVNSIENDGLARAIMEGFQEILSYRNIEKGGRILLVPKIEGFGSQYQERVSKDVIDEARKLKETIGLEYDCEEDLSVRIIPPKNVVQFKIETLDGKINEFKAGVSFESEYASFEPMFFIRQMGMASVYCDGEFLPNGKPLTRTIHFINRYGIVKTYNFDGKEGFRVTTNSFEDLKDSIRKRREYNEKPKLEGMDYGTVKAEALLSKEAYPL